MYLGIDTSNYTTSVSLFDGEKILLNSKKLLTVKQGERGLRQSDAVFQHTVNLPELVKDIKFDGCFVEAVAVSSKPRNIDGSYMPCFLVGVNTAQAVSRFTNSPLYKTSHQVGHILAALYSADKLTLIDEPFIAFHFSGGTSEALLVEPDKNEIIKASAVAQSTDLKAGQAIDRAGVMLGINFPCGKELDYLSLQSEKEFKHKIAMKDLNCSFSGIENKVRKMIEDGESNFDISKFVITYISDAVDKMTQGIIKKYGELPLVYAGGVMSNTLIKQQLRKKYNAHFADPQFSCDNAAGIAIYGYIKSRK